MSVSLLPFSVSIARDVRTLREACAVRALAYGHHMADRPEMTTALAEPDATDLATGSVVLVCRDKNSGELIGTARIQRNHAGPLPIEAAVLMPPSLHGTVCAEITRLAIRPGAHALVRPMLVKACWMYAMASQIRHLVIGARSAALVRIYKGLGFVDLLGGATVPLAHAGGLPHHVLSFDIVAAERHWHAAQHGLYAFMVQTWHPDLQLIPDPALAPRVETVAPRFSRRWVGRRPVGAGGGRRSTPAAAVHG